jgi:hypothetical protein
MRAIDDPVALAAAARIVRTALARRRREDEDHVIEPDQDRGRSSYPFLSSFEHVQDHEAGRQSHDPADH